MECINPDCTKAELLKKLFAGVEKLEELPKFCPFCQQPLRQNTDREKAQEETRISIQNDETVVHKEEKRPEAATKPPLQHPSPVESQDVGERVVKDEKPAVKDNIWSQHDANDNVHSVHHDLTTGSDETKNRPLPEVVKQNTNSGEDVSCSSTSGQGLVSAPAISRHPESSLNAMNSQGSGLDTKRKKDETTHDSDNHNKDAGIQYVTTTTTEGAVTKRKHKPDTSNVTQHASSDDTSYQSTSSKGSWEITDKSVQWDPLLNSRIHMDSSSSPDKTMLSKLDCEDQKMNENSNNDKTHTSGQSKHLEENEHTSYYNTRYQASLNASQRPARENNNQDSKETMNQNHPSSNQGPNGVNKDPAKGNVSILGNACVFGDITKSIQNSSSASDIVSTGENLKGKSSQGTEQRSVNKGEGINKVVSKSKKKNMDLNPEKKAEGSAERECNSRSSAQVTEDDNKSGSDSSTDQESETEEESKLEGKKSGPKPYGKEEIKEAKKKRKNKKKSGGKKPHKKEEDIDARGQIKMPPKCDEDNVTHGKLQQHQPVGHENSREKLKDIQPTVNAPPPTDANTEDCITVIFHGLLSPDFHFDPEKQKISIRAGLDELGRWDWNCAKDFTVIGQTKDKFVSFVGEMQVPVRFLRRALPYKYIVYSNDSKKQKVHWEFSEFRDDHPHTIVDRDLFLLEEFRKKNGIYHQYDGVIYPQPEQTNIVGQVVNWIKGAWHDRKQKFLKYRLHAAETFLPKWRGFVVDENYEQMSAKEAIEKTRAISRCLEHVSICLGFHEIKKRIDGLDFRKILSDFLKSKLEHNAKLSKKDLESSPVRVERLVSTLAIVHLIAQHKLGLTYLQLKDILHCLVMQTSGDKCDFYDIRKDFPEEMWSDLVKSVLHVMKAANDEHYSKCCPDVILAVPLLHFLRKDLKPFEEPEVTHPKTAREWCRAEGLPQFKLYKSIVDSLLPEALPMFTLDPMLRRLFLHCTPLEDLPKLSANIAFPVHEISTALFYKVRSGNFSLSKFATVDETLSTLLKRQTSKQRQARLDQSKALLFAEVAFSLLQELDKKVKSNDKLFFTGIQFAIETLCSVYGPKGESKTMQNEQQSMNDDTRHKCEGIFCKIVDMVEAVVEKEFKYSVYMSSYAFIGQQVKELEVWTTLLNLNVSRKNLENNWIRSLCSAFEKRLKQVKDEDVVELFCKVENDENFHQSLVQCITQHAFLIVERIAEKGGTSDRSFTALQEKILRSGGSSKAGELLSRMITRAWSKSMAKKTVTEHEVLRSALTWRPWAGFFSFHGSQEKQKILSQDASNLLHRVIGCLIATQDALANGSIDVRTWMLLNQYEDNFIRLCSALFKVQTTSEGNSKPHPVKEIKRNLEKRNEEYGLFHVMKAQVQHFIDICKSSRDVDFDINGLQMKATCDTSDVRMIDLCKRVPSSDDLTAERVEVVFFDCLPSMFHSILPHISAFYKSKTFQSIWKSKCKALYSEKKGNEMLSGKLTLLDLQDKVWPASIEKWTSLAQSVYDGSINLKDVDRNFKKLVSEENLKEELDVMFLQTVKEIPFRMDQVAGERVGQITRYRSLQNYVVAAEIVWNFKEALGLAGDFGVIEDLRNQVTEEFKDKDLKSINERFTKAGEYLVQISSENSHCLDAVIKCEPLVKWLRETIKDTSALSTLVDLAMISAGENDLEVDRISNFHTSCLSFAPLIFDLNKNFGFEELMRACGPVWEAVKQDKKLSVKLAETCRHLEWLKAVQSSHGSVEMSSIMQAKAINSSGVFRVGQISQDSDGGLSVSSGKKDLDNVLTLSVPIDPRTRDPRRRHEEEEEEEEEKVELKTYSLNDLKDLQSKLMLIAGKTAQLQNKDCIESTEEVNRFVEVLEGVMRLGQVYIDLCEAGDVGYLEWSEEIHCSRDRLSLHRSVAKELAETSCTMEERLQKWRSHVHDKRHEYKQLNHYTTKQILVMRRALGKLREGACAGDMPLQVYTLLESVLPDTTSQDLNQVLVETLGFEMVVARTNMSECLLPPPTPQQGSFRSANLRERFQAFLLSVEKMDFYEDVAIAALKANDVTKTHDINEDNLVKWCMEHGEDEDLVSEWYDKANEDKDFEDFFPDRWQDEEQDEEQEQEIKVEDVSVEVLPQDEFEQHSYLSLDELGSVLARLSSKCAEPDARKFPDYLSREQPNLILVPKGDVLPTVLTLYMQYGGNSLPTANEVLVCTHETTAEEIELFWWRAFQDTNHQMFCLVHPDVLDYNVSQTAVNMLGILMRKFEITEEGYRIIILCSTENEDRSHIIAALDEYRLNAAPSCASADVLSDYLTKQFTCSTSSTGYFNNKRVSWIPAANLDSDSISVRRVCSNRAGTGKSLMITRLFERIQNLQNNLKVTELIENLSLTVTVPLHGTVANTSPLLDGLWKHPVRGDLPVSRIVHLDVSPSVTEGLETLLFNLLVLGVLYDNSGRLWRRKSTDLYMIEMTSPILKASPSTDKWSGDSFISLLPTTSCTTPRTTLQNLKTNQTTKSPLFEDQEYRSVPVQRVFQYLKACDDARQILDRFKFVPGRSVGTQAECLALIIKHCGIRDPSWSELKHFVDFLNSQLHDCEENIFCNPDHVDDQWMQGTLRGFTSFVIRFMVTMSRDFATPSLDDDPIVCSAGLSAEEDDDEDIRPLQLRRRWESSPHPYIFFNEDHITMTFLGFHINANGDLIDPDTQIVIQSALMTKQLRTGLEHQKVDFKTNYSGWTKKERIHKVCCVMGVKDQVDPDTSYELTIDNMKKILAIHMRFRCGIPVVIMGETGCGKTRLIRYMCALQAGPKGQRNMLLMKVHGGTSYKDIEKKVEQAEKMAAENEKKGIDTVLFFDEANTTNALGMIKEVMVDRRINGRPVGVGLRGLHFIAACNPYRRHTEKMIKKLESAGLGYSVKSEETKDKLGRIPLRHLVYRVHALPASMRPLVWDFGQLKPEIEELYIRQIVSRYVVIERSIPGNDSLVKAISNVLAAAQKYMRQQQDECSFVSLRDVERTMTVMTWFYRHRVQLRPQAINDDDEDSDEDEDEEEEESIDLITWSLIMSLGVCYHAKLQDRKAFRKAVISACAPPLVVNGGQKRMHREIVRCQEVMINHLSLGPNIARNTALSENVFMMVVCIELRIPLFVIGKPGSSKSLAKTVVADNMQGDASKSQLFKTFKRAHMVSYQCSPLSTPDGIVATFRQCRRLQENNPGDRYASVVVLDEVGLAEDSPLLPLKALHPLLEDGVTSSDDIIETDEKPTRVAFIGISNWALDPAKMNRGLMLMRGEPSKGELIDSARGICAESEDIRQHLSTLLEQLAAGYADLYARQKNFKSLRTSKRDEFFGLRDFYSLVKMVYSIAAEKNGRPTWPELEHAIRRNFGGLDEIDAVEIFQKHVTDGKLEKSEPVDTLDLLRASLDHRNAVGESRYLLVLTENYSALRIVEQELIKNKDNYVVIFGSSFPKDQEYTQVCRNINQIKVCMETGRTVVLLNLESLYESLYDALNQYYVYCADQKYVDLGLGSHRVKCRVDDSFRLIVIAEKEVVYKKFPIPLINRLEKHYLVTSKSLRPAQLDLANDLKKWAEDFAQVQRPRHEIQKEFAIGDAFVGYQSDTIPAIVLQACAESSSYTDEASSEDWLPEVKEKCQNLLLQCATPDAMARLSRTRLSLQAKVLWDAYFRQQEHSSLSACLKQLLDQTERCQKGLLVQVSTHSRLLSENDLEDVCHATHFKRRDVELLTLQQFQTEQQFLKQVREFFISLSNDEGILLVQCDSGDVNFNLIACTRHLLMDQKVKRAEMLKEKLKIEDVPPLHIVIIIQLPRVKGGCVNFVGFQGGQWSAFHVDDLRPPTNQIPPIQMLIDRPISELLKPVQSVSREISVEDEENKGDIQDEEEMLTEEGEEEVQTERKAPEIMEIDEEEDIVKLLEQERMSSNVGRFDPMVLLRRSVQAAAGRLEDDAVLAKRTTERIDLILSLLPEDSSKMPDGPSFAKSLHWKIYNLLLEKNEKQSGDLARHWVRHEALSGTSVHERGTFRRALQHKVLTEVEPLLAKVFAYADRDCNLDLLRDQQPWILRLWIFIFNNKRLSEICYELSASSTMREHVQVSGKGKHVFRCCFPFSWLIKELIDELWRGLPQGSSRSSESEEDKLRRIMENSELRSILSVIREEGKGDEAGRRYLHDFVHMVYKPNKETQEEEVQLVSRAILAAAEKRSSEDVHLDFAAIHVAFNLMQSRLNNFNLLVQAEPDLTSLLLEHPNPHLTIDVAGLRACLEKLQPNLDDLETSEKRSEWCGRVLDVRKTIEAMTSKEAFTKRRGAIDDYDEGEKKALQQCWEMWQRLSVVRLFIDHVCSFSRQTNAEDAKNIFKLWKMLGDETNFLKATCIRGLEGFLLQCSQEHRKRNKCFEVTCDICKGQAKKPSVTPCGHCCCLECSSRWFSEQSTCPRCRQPVPADYTPAESEEVREALNNITSFRNHCNSFFMEVVSLFCFGYSPCGTLEEDAYKLLMDYVTGEKTRGGTRRFSPFPDQGIDINPVVRSFLLQQLLKSSDQKVKDYMSMFIERAHDIQEMDAASSVEVFVMCIQCMEDVLNSKFVRFGSQQELDQKLRLLETDFKAAAALLGEAREDEALDIKWLEGIANTRFVLSKAADFMYQSRNDARSQNWSNPDVNRALDRLIGEVKKICVKTQMNTPRLFLLKQLSRKFGFESINALAEEFEWMLSAEAKETSELTQDRFLVYGLEYQNLRETISRAVISGDMDTIQKALQDMTSPGHVASVALLLGIYQEITTNKQGFISETIQQRLQDFVQNSENISDQSRVLARDLVTKTKGNIPDMVLGVAGDTPWDRSLVEIIVHLAAVMFSRDGDDLAGPLLSLALRPAAIANTFLPTMPEDPLQDVRSAVVGTLYECPNGHPYLVTECGRPTEQIKCRVPDCRADIGGVNHQLTRANRAARTSDLSKKGHCLGFPTERGTNPTPEREMSALATSLLRLLVHGSMLIGSCYHKQDIGQLISPAIPQDSVLGFLWKHAMCDMNLLSKVSGRSVDDTALIVHMVLRSLSEHAPARQGLRDALKTKEERKQWENNFSTSLVVPLMTNLESSIQKTVELIVNDKRFGANPLLRQLYELESCVDDSQSKINSNCLALWRYRTPVTLDHVTRAFNESGDAQDEDCVVLREFLKNEHKLRAVRFLPDVVKLQQLLMDRYHRTLNKTEMDKLKWKDFEKRLPKGTTKAEYKALRKSFRLAWDIMVAILKEQGTKGTIRKVLQHSVDDDSPISMFIPANSGLGTCSMFLVQFLVRAHNDFMELYKRYSGNTPNQQLAPVKEVTCSQLVSYDADRDLLPLMQAHCHYSLEVGHGTLVEYDWTAIQRQLVDRLVRGRVLVDFKEAEYIKTAQVSAESVLTTLKIKIPQVELSVAIEAQIAGQYRSLEDVCEALSSLNIAITFLASGGGKRSMLISNYIHQVLKLPEDAGLRNIKAQEVCQIQHAVSLWRLLSFERAKILTKRKQDPFEHLSPEFKVGLPEAVEVSVNSVLRKMSDKCLDSFGSVLLEVIVLRLNDSLDINKDWSLKSYMTWYLDDKDVDPIPEVEDIPDEVLLEHIVRFWQIVYTMSDKYHDRRMEATG